MLRKTLGSAINQHRYLEQDLGKGRACDTQFQESLNFDFFFIIVKEVMDLYVEWSIEGLV